MQLCLDEQERKLLAGILEKREAELRAALLAASPAGDGLRQALAARQALVLGLWQHVIDRELGLSSEELDTLAAMLAEQQSDLREEISRAPEAAREKLRRRQALLGRLSDKVTEACAMA